MQHTCPYIFCLSCEKNATATSSQPGSGSTQATHSTSECPRAAKPQTVAARLRKRWCCLTDPPSKGVPSGVHAPSTLTTTNFLNSSPPFLDTIPTGPVDERPLANSGTQHTVQHASACWLRFRYQSSKSWLPPSLHTDSRLQCRMLQTYTPATRNAGDIGIA